MYSIVSGHKLYFRLYFLFFLSLFIYQLTAYQSDAILFFSENRTGFLDIFFKTITQFGEEWAYISLFIFFLLKKDKQFATTIALTGIIILLISPLFKIIFSHPRPYRVFEEAQIASQINLVKGYEILRGVNSFPSGHSMAAFALWSLMAFKYKNSLLVVLCFLIAVLVGISRIYLVAHFPQDVLFGSAIGVCIATVIYGISKRKDFFNFDKKV